MAAAAVANARALRPDVVLMDIRGPGTDGITATAAITGEGLADLTGREREVLVALGRGLSNVELAAELVITEATAKTHVSRVLAKLGCTSRVQAAIRAREAGLV